MSAIAKYLLSKGKIVLGSDIHDSPEIRLLQSRGATVFIGHNAENVKTADCVIYNSAIKSCNPELLYALKNNIAVIDRIEFLNIIASKFSRTVGIAGCHGKTTATAMLANVIKASDIEFLSHIGGEDNNLGNFYHNGDDIFVTEVCEFNKNIDRFNSEIACVLNIDFDHADCYINLKDLKNTYYNYLNRSKIQVINADDKLLAAYRNNNTIAFGINNKADVYCEKISLNSGKPSFNVNYFGKSIPIELNVYGLHNIYNALNTVITAKLIGIDDDTIRTGINNFSGIKRRFEQIGNINGATVICDYAHHPKEIRASFQTVKEIACGKIYTLFQPHTYSRTKSLMSDFVNVFKDIKNLSIYSTYAAREEFDYLGSAEKLFCEIGTAENYFTDPLTLKKYLRRTLQQGDTLLVLGAGDIYDIVKDFT